jgi:hypothetical protein
MRRDSNLLRRHALGSAVVIIFGSCGADGAPAEVPLDEPARVVASDDEPVPVILLADAATSWFLDVDPPPPPRGRVVIARGDGGIEDGFDDGAPVGEANDGVIEVEPEIMSALAAYGLTQPLMTLAEETGNGRILVDPAFQSSDLGRRAPMVNRPGLQGGSSIVLAGHVASSNPKCLTSVTACKTQGGDRCSVDRRHWFRLFQTTANWCQLPQTCGC